MRHITDLLGIKRPALRQWMELGFVSPSIKADGHGTRNLWSREDVLGLAVFQKLLEHGFTREEAAQTLREPMSLFVDKRGCKLGDRLEFQVEDMLGYDTIAARVNCSDGTTHNILVTRADVSAFAALDAAAQHLGIPDGIASTKMVSITDAKRHVAEEL